MMEKTSIRFMFLVFLVLTLLKGSLQLKQIYLVGSRGLQVINITDLFRLAPHLSLAGPAVSTNPDTNNTNNKNNFGNPNNLNSPNNYDIPSNQNNYLNINNKFNPNNPPNPSNSYNPFNFNNPSNPMNSNNVVNPNNYNSPNSYGNASNQNSYFNNPNSPPNPSNPYNPFNLNNPNNPINSNNLGNPYNGVNQNNYNSPNNYVNASNQNSYFNNPSPPNPSNPSNPFNFNNPNNPINSNNLGNPYNGFNPNNYNSNNNNVNASNQNNYFNNPSSPPNPSNPYNPFNFNNPNNPIDSNNLGNQYNVVNPNNYNSPNNYVNASNQNNYLNLNNKLNPNSPVNPSNPYGSTNFNNPNNPINSNYAVNPNNLANPSKTGNSGSAMTNAQDICVTKGCVKIAAFIIENMDETVDPCQDFYNFTCGGYLSKKIIPEDKAFVSVFSEISDKLDERMRIVLEQGTTKSDSKATTMAKNLYNSCMNTTQTEKRGLLPLRSILDGLGGWPVLEMEAWDASNFSMMDALYANRKRGFPIDTLFSFDVIVDDRNSSRRIITMDQADLGVDREHLVNGLEDPVVKAYLKYATEVAELLGADEDTAKQELTKALTFEMELANISIPKEERRNFTQLYNIMSLKELQELVPQIPWLAFMNKILPPSVQITMDEKINVVVPKFYLDLSSLLNKVDKRTLANYMVWRVIKEAASYLTEELTELEFDFEKVLDGESEPSPLWKDCVKLVQDNLPFAVGNLYVKHYFNDEAKSKTKTMVQYLRNTFNDILKSVDWMDEATRAKALQKANAIQTNIAYPDELMMDNKLEEYYGNLIVDQNSIFDNVLRLNVFSTDHDYGLLHQKVDKTDWKLQSSVAKVNAYYDFNKNSITFPAGILQGAMFDSTFPQYVNYGGIGQVIGHEITHGFDDMGSQFDADGNLNNWWQPETAQKFQEKAKCIINQYTGYAVPQIGLQLNGVNSQGEDIADNGGAKESYMAYQNWVQDNGPELVLPGLSYSTNQLFWISLAVKECEKSRPEHARQQILTDEHTPYRFRVIGTLSNSPEFARDFNCPAGSMMNPVHKCTVW